MKISHIIFNLIIFSCAFIVSLPLLAADKPVKIAVMGSESDLGKEIDLLTVEFSKDKSISVLSRSEWTKLIREYEILKQDTASAYSKFGNLSGADALIILQKSELKGKKDIMAKLVTTKTGLVIDALILPKSSKEMGWVAGIKKHFNRKIAKLAKAKDGLPTVSLLNIRAETSGSELLELEKQINALFSYRLKRNENILVTERQNMPEVLFEKYLNKGDESEFKTGKAVVDGCFNLVEDKVIINYRIKKADGKIAKFKITENKKKIAKIADQLVDKTLKIINSKATKKQEWNREKEAQEYLEEAAWAYNCGLFDTAAQASEAAWALGCRDDKIHALRIIAYANIASNGFMSSLEDNIPAPPDVSKTDKYINAAITAMELFKHHIIPKLSIMNRKEIKEFSQRTIPHNFYNYTDLEIKLYKAVTGPLRAYYNQNLINKDADKTTFLRKLIRESKKRKRKNWLSSYPPLVSYNIPFWFPDPASQQKEYFRLLNKSKVHPIPRLIWKALLKESEGSSIDMPLIFIDWTGKTNTEGIKELEQKLIDKMISSPNAHHRLYGKLAKAIKGQKISQTDIETIVGSFIPEIKTGEVYLNGPLLYKMNKRYRYELMFILLEHVLEEPKHPTWNIYHLINKNYTPRTEEKKKLEDFYERLIAANTKKSKKLALRLNDKYNLKYEVCEKSIIINKISSKEVIGQASIASDFVTEGKTFYCFDTKDHNDSYDIHHLKRKCDVTIFYFSTDSPKAKVVGQLKNHDYWVRSSLAVSDKYIVLILDSEINCYDRKAASWKKFSAPGNSITGAVIEGNNLWVVSAAHQSTGCYESSFRSIDLKTGKNQIYASTRRNPPKSILDNTHFYLWKIKKIDKNTFLLGGNLGHSSNNVTADDLYIFEKTNAKISKLKDMPLSFYKKYIVKCIIREDTYRPTEAVTLVFKTADIKFFTCGFMNEKGWCAKKGIPKVVPTIDLGKKDFSLYNFKNVFELAPNQYLTQQESKIDGITRPTFLLIGEKIDILPIHPGKVFTTKNEPFDTLNYSTSLFFIGEYFVLDASNQKPFLIVPQKDIMAKLKNKPKKITASTPRKTMNKLKIITMYISRSLCTAGCLCVFALSLSLNAADKPVKIAVMGSESDLGKEIDLLTAEFSKDENLIVLSRSEWSKLTREYEILKQDTASAYSKFGNISGADALIILQQSNINGKKDIIAKLVTTKTGLVLDAIVLPSLNSEEMGWIKGITKHFKRKLAKIASSKKLTTVSLLNIRAETSIPELLELEKQINALFSYRLKREASLLVTERQNMPEVLFEKYLNKGDESEFKTGSGVVDGSFNLDGDKVVINLRIKKTNGQIDKFKITENRKEIAKIADQLTAKTLKTLNSKSSQKASWDIKKEAQEYLNEATWAYNCGLYDIAAQASEAAWALGCRKEKLIFLRIFSYANIAYPVRGMSTGDYTPKSIDVKNTDAHINAAIISMDLLKRYIITPHKTGQDKSYRFADHSWKDIVNKTLLSASRCLRVYYDCKCTEKDQRKTSYLKVLIRDTASFMLQSSGQLGSFSGIAIVYLPFWYENVGEMKKAYKDILLESRRDAGAGFCNGLRETFAAIHRDQVPYFIDWKREKTQEELNDEFKEFILKLSRSASPQLQADALWVRYRNYLNFFDDKSQDEVKKQFCQVVKTHKERIYQGRLWLNQLAFEMVLPAEIIREIVMGYPLYLINNPDKKLGPDIHDMIDDKVISKSFSDAKLKELHSLILRWEKSQKKDKSSQKAEFPMMSDFSDLKNIIYRRLPNLKKNKEATLVLSKYWTPYKRKLTENENFYYTLSGTVVFGNSILCVANDDANDMPKNYYIFILDKKLKIQHKILIPKKDTINAKIGISEKYIAIALRKQILIYNRKTRLWNTIDFKTRCIDNVCLDGENIFAFFTSYSNQQRTESGIIKLDISGKNLKILASSRRNPPQSPLDNRKPFLCRSFKRIETNTILFSTVRNSFIICDEKIIPLDKINADFQKKHLIQIYQNKGSFPYNFVTLKNEKDQRFVCKIKDINSILKITKNTIPVTKLSFSEIYVQSAFSYKNSLLVSDDHNSFIYINKKFPHGIKIPCNMTSIEHVLKDMSCWGIGNLDAVSNCDGELIMSSISTIIPVNINDIEKVAEKIIKKKEPTDD